MSRHKIILPLLGGAVLIAFVANKNNKKKPSSNGSIFNSSDTEASLAVPLIKRSEGFMASAYPDPIDPKNGPVTIGYGTTKYPNGSLVKIGDKVNESEATYLLNYHIQEDIIPKLRHIPIWKLMNDAQQSSLVSFAYNLGSGFYGSGSFKSLTNAINSADWNNLIPKSIMLYVYAGGKKVKGLVLRRAEEVKLWQGDPDLIKELKLDLI